MWQFSKILLFTGLLALATVVRAQHQQEHRQLDNDYGRFLQIMNRETGRSDGASWHQYYLVPEELPAWFFDPALHTEASSFFIGISDPGMDSSKAVQMAIHRGKALALLAGQATIRHISDHYEVMRESATYHQDGSHYLDFSRLQSASPPPRDSFVVEKRWYNKYGEGMVLLAAHEDGRGKKMMVEGEIMELHREEGRSVSQTLLCRLSVAVRADSSGSPPVPLSDYEVEGAGRRYHIHSSFRGDTSNVPGIPYRYAAPEEYTRETPLQESGVSLHAGLWQGYLRLLFSRVTFQAYHLKGRVKSTYDQHTLKQQQIVRTASSNRISFYIESMALAGDELTMDLEVQTLR